MGRLFTYRASGSQGRKTKHIKHERILSLEALGFQWKKPSNLPRKNGGKKRKKGSGSNADVKMTRATNRSPKKNKP